MTVFFLGCQLAFDNVLRRNAGVIGTGHPEDVVPLHPLPATKDIL